MYIYIYIYHITIYCNSQISHYLYVSLSLSLYIYTYIFMHSICIFTYLSRAHYLSHFMTESMAPVRSIPENEDGSSPGSALSRLRNSVTVPLDGLNNANQYHGHRPSSPATQSNRQEHQCRKANFCPHVIPSSPVPHW